MSDAPADEPTIKEPRRRFAGPQVLGSMVVVLLAVFAFLILPVVLKAQQNVRGQVDTYAVVNAFPHDPAAFTQGLLYADLGGDIGPALYESTGIAGRSSLRRVDVETGEVLLQADVPDGRFAEGIALIGRRIYQLTWRGGFGYIYDAADFRRIGTFPLPPDVRTGRPIEGWGLTTDGESLIVSDGSYTVRYLDPATFEVTRTLEVREGRRPIVRVNELEWVQQEIWANVWKTDSIVRINPKTGQVRGFVDLAGLKPRDMRYTRADLLAGKAQESVLNGIAFDRKRSRIFVTGKLWPKLFEIRVVPK